MNNKANKTSFKKGHKHSEEVLEKLRKPRPDYIPWNKGNSGGINEKIRTGKYIQCKVCGKSIYLMPYEIKSGRKKFCSKECLYKGGTQTMTFQKGHPDLVPKEKRGHTEETRVKIGLGSIGKHCGKLSWNWKNGISGIDRLCRGMTECKQWRSDVFERDKGLCYRTPHKKF